MTTTLVLWLFLQNGQVQTIQGFRSAENCREVGGWYQREAREPLQFKCGPGPDQAAGVQLPFPFPLVRR